MKAEHVDDRLPGLEGEDVADLSRRGGSDCAMPGLTGMEAPT